MRKLSSLILWMRNVWFTALSFRLGAEEWNGQRKLKILTEGSELAEY